MNKKKWMSFILVILLLFNTVSVANAGDTTIYNVATAKSLVAAIEEINSAAITSTAVKICIQGDIDLTEVSNFESINMTSDTNYSIEIYSSNNTSYTITLDGEPLFDNMTNTTITDLNLAGSVTGSGSSTGALANTASNSTISNVSTSAIVTNTSNGNAGGLIGSTSGTISLTAISNTGKVSGGTAGGIVGKATGTTTFDGTCSNTGTIVGTIAASNIVGQASTGTVGDTSFTLELSDQATATSTWKDGNFSLDLSKYITNTSGKSCTYKLAKSSSYYSLNETTGVLKITNNSSTAMDAGTYTIDVDITANNITTREQVIIKITARTFSKDEFTLSSETKTYDGTLSSIKKSISSTIWSTNDYTLDYQLNMTDWTVTLTVTPVTSRTNVSTSAKTLTYTYSVESGIEIEDTDISVDTNGASTFPSGLADSKVVVKKDNVSDGCVYESDISFYKSQEGNYSYSAYSSTAQ